MWMARSARWVSDTTLRGSKKREGAARGTATAPRAGRATDLDPARSHGGARSGAGRLAGQVRISLQHVARDPHSDERDPGHGRTARRNAFEPRPEEVPRHHAQPR